jgi:hypothetical protein
VRLGIRFLRALSAQARAKRKRRKHNRQPHLDSLFHLGTQSILYGLHAQVKYLPVLFDANFSRRDAGPIRFLPH